jgi:iron complex outermembrane recepter protein
VGKSLAFVRKSIHICASWALLAGIHPSIASADLSSTRHFDIPAQALPGALLKFAEQSGVQVTSSGEAVENKRSQGIRGDLQAKGALDLLLQGTHLGYDVIDHNTVAIHPLKLDKSSSRSATEQNAGSGSSSDDQSNEKAPRSFSGPFRLAQVDQGASTSAPAVENSTQSMEEVVVTAQKRAERLQDVPISVSAFDQDAVSKLAIVGFEELSREVPSLSFSTGGTEPYLSIRGPSTAYGLEPAVSVYIDDTPLDVRMDAFSGSTLIDLYDLDHIEVLRGPQGTLFGASSLGGAIRVITAQPDTSKFSANTQLGVADTERGAPSYVADGAVNLPLSSTLALRLVATYSDDGGWIDRSLPTDFTDITPGEPITRRNENTVRRSSARVVMRWTPDDTWTITPSFIFQNIGTQGLPEYYPDEGLFIRPHLFTDQGTFNATIASLKIEKDLGAFSLTSVSSYLEKRTVMDLDWGEFGQLFAQIIGVQPPTIAEIPYILPVSYREWTQEFRATSRNAGHWRWLLGAYFNDTTQVNTEFANSDQFLPAGTTDVYYYDAPVHDVQYAGFGELTFAPSDQLEITAGLRAYGLRTTEQITQGGLVGGPNVPKTIGTASGVNPKFTATYKLDPSVTVFATAAKGFRAGGPNSALVSPGPSLQCTFISAYNTIYDPDTVWNYEVGTKTSFLNGAGAFNASLFELDWDNFQGPVISNCGSFTANIGKARTRGVELESSISPIQNLSLRATFSYDDARIQSVDQGLQSAGVGMPGDQLVNIPKVQFSLGGEFNRPAFSDWAWFVRPNWQYVGSAPTSYTDLSSGATRPAYSNVDLTVGFEKTGWEASLYAHNLTNSVQVTSILAPLLDGYQYLVNRPRTYGVILRASF